MKATRLIGMSAALVTLAGYGSLAQADAAAGKATFEAVCSECHEVADFDGEDPKEISATLKEIVAGTKKHKKALKLTDAQIADVAAYMAGGGK
jgi:mono/diheme cytochrome c family protein